MLRKNIIQLLSHSVFPKFGLLLLSLLFSSNLLFAQLTTTGTNIKDACGGMDNGSVDILITGSTGTLTLTILGPNAPLVLSPTDGVIEPITGLEAGGYVAVGQDTNGDLDAFVFTIGTVSPALSSSILSQSDNTDCTSQNGAIDINVSGGTGSYSYSWTGPNGFIATTQDVTLLEGGDYFVDVIDDGSNCFNSHGPITLANPTIAVQNITSAVAVAVCPTDNITVSLASSEVKVNYEIMVNGAGSGAIGVGTGAALDIILPSGSFGDTDVLTVEGSAGVCANVLMTGSVTVTINVASIPPTSASVSDPVYCNNNLPVGGITLTYVAGTLGTGATAEWYDDAGFTSNVGTGNGLNIAAPVVSTTYFVRFEGVCGNTTAQSVSVTVDIAADATISAAGPFCETDVSANLLAATAGGTWTGTGITNGALGTFDPVVAGAGVHTITYTVLTGTCISIDTENITVDFTPDATITAAGPFCETDASVNLVAATAGGTWSGTGITNAALGTFDPATAGPGTHTITYSVANGACMAVDTEDLIVESSPDATIVAAGPFCQTDASVNLLAATAGGTWSGTGITDGILGTFDPVIAGVGVHTITYTLTIGTCTSVDTEDIVVEATPDATITAAGPFCETDASVNLAAATGGGVWSGTGIIDGAAGTFDPATAGVGVHTITYTLTVGTCTSVDTEDFTVDSTPDATITAAGPFCEIDASVNLLAATAGGTWSGTGITDGVLGTFDPVIAGVGVHTITYTLTIGTCTSVDTEDIVVEAIPDATVSTAGPFCETDASVNLVAATGGGIWSGTGITDGVLGTFDPVTAGVGVHTITYTVTIGTCIAVDTEDFTVDPTPDPTIIASGPFCEADASVTLAAATAGGTWSGAGITDGALGTFDPVVAGPGVHTITYDLVIGGCTTLDTEDITVVANPSAVIAGAVSVCSNTTEIYSVPAGETSYLWTLTGGNSAIVGATNTNTVTVDWVTTGGTLAITVVGAAPTSCVSNSNIAVTIFSVLPALATQSSDFCQDEALPILVATPEPGATVSWFIGSSATGTLVGTGDTYTPSTTELDMTTPGTTVFTYIQDISCLTSLDADYTVNIIALPNAGTDSSISTCGSDGTIDLITQLGGTPDTGGAWTDDDGSGGLSGGIFDPAVSGVGTFNFTYQVDGAGACSSVTETAVVTVSVSSGVVATIGEVVNTYPEQDIGAIEVVNIISGNLPIEISLEDNSGNVIHDWVTLEADRLGEYSHLFTLLSQGDYVVVLRDASGCDLLIPQSITLESGVFIPNVITPNGDGYNEFFKILNMSSTAQIQISNRWGVSVFSSSDYQNDWQGENLADGVYFYSIKMAGEVYQGNVEIWRNDGSN